MPRFDPSKMKLGSGNSGAKITIETGDGRIFEFRNVSCDITVENEVSERHPLDAHIFDRIPVIISRSATIKVYFNPGGEASVFQTQNPSKNEEKDLITTRLLRLEESD